MADINFKKSAGCLLFSLLISLPVLANELTDRQFSVTEAQKKYDLEKTRYDDATVLVNEQKQRVAADQALLEERQKKQAAAKASMDKAKAQLELENKRLKKIWNKGNH